MSLKVEGSRDKEIFWHVQYIKPGLTRDEAHREFLRAKPWQFTFEKFHYDRHTGRVMAA
jgi:hypothetical protein